MTNARVVPSPSAVVWLVALAAVVGGGCGGGKSSSSKPTTRAAPVRAQLKLERAVSATSGRPELVVSLLDAKLNNPATTDGETSVLLRCVDEAGGEVLRQSSDWPLLEEPGFPPHLHMPIRPDLVDRVRGCRLTGGGIDFEGSLRGPLPDAR